MIGVFYAIFLADEYVPEQLKNQGIAMMIFGLVCLTGSAVKLWVNMKRKKKEDRKEAFVSRDRIIRTVS